MERLLSKFSATATCIIIFDANRCPIYILRDKNIPLGLRAAAKPDDSEIVKDYLDSDTTGRCRLPPRQRAGHGRG